MREKIESIINNDEYLKEMYENSGSFKISIQALLDTPNVKTDEDLLAAAISIICTQSDIYDAFINIIAAYGDENIASRIRDLFIERTSANKEFHNIL
jgi:3-methyladenine DNA glycosylase Tag